VRLGSSPVALMKKREAPDAVEGELGAREKQCKLGNTGCDGAPACIARLNTMPFGSQAFRDLFLLSPNIRFLNHGSFGATPKVVLGKQRQLINQLESHPDQWFRRAVIPMVRNSAAELAKFVGANKEDLVFVQNATTGINAVLRSLELHQGDGVLCLSLHYRPILTTLRQTCEYKQEIIELRELEIAYPIPTADELCQQVDAALAQKPHIRLAVFDHITSPSALVLPIERLVKICRRHDVRVLIDGAHAPGQIPLDLNRLNADYYVGTCHKWLFSPKGSAFLWAKREVQSVVCPLVTVAWGGDFIDGFSYQGTRDETAFACVGTALRMYHVMGVERTMERNRQMAEEMGAYLAALWGTQTLAPKCMQGSFMSTIQLPMNAECSGFVFGTRHQCQECDHLRDVLLRQFQIEASMIFHYKGRLWIRISCQVYNVKEDYEALGAAILALTKESKRAKETPTDDNDAE